MEERYELKLKKRWELFENKDNYSKTEYSKKVKEIEDEFEEYVQKHFLQIDRYLKMKRLMGN